MLRVLESSHWHCQYCSSRTLLYSFQLGRNTTSSFQRSPTETVRANWQGGKRAPLQRNSVFAIGWKKSTVRVKPAFHLCPSVPGCLNTYLNSSESVLYKQAGRVPAQQPLFSCAGPCTAVSPPSPHVAPPRHAEQAGAPHKPTRASPCPPPRPTRGCSTPVCVRVCPPAPSRKHNPHPPPHREAPPALLHADGGGAPRPRDPPPCPAR